MEREIINQSMEFILEHLEEELSVAEIAEQFHFSEYYFNRAFHAATGESVYAFMKRQRMNQSAIEMKVNKEKTITDIGEKYGYSSSNYSSAFKKLKHISPAEFRKNANQVSSSNPFKPEKTEQFQSFEWYQERIVVKRIGNMRVLYERFIGNYGELKEVWYRFIREHENDIGKDTVFVERFYDDPKVAELDQCICDLCICVEDGFPGENVIVIEGGKFAVYRYERKIEEIYRTLQGIFSIWLPQSPYRMERRYGLNIYHAVDQEKDSVRMDLCIPVQ